MSIYTTQEGDMVDYIAFKVYADTLRVQFIYDANPGLVDQPLLLPSGLLIYLPDQLVQAPTNVIADVWS